MTHPSPSRVPGGLFRRSWSIHEGPLYQLQRVETEEGRSLLVKRSLVDSALDAERWLLHEARVFETLNVDWTLSPLGSARQGEQVLAYYADAAAEPALPALLEPCSYEDWIARLYAMCDILQGLHDRGVLLLGVTPHSYLKRLDGSAWVLADALFASVAGATEPRLDGPYWAPAYLRYVAPEVIGRSGRRPDPRADLYSLGALLYESLAGRPPFDSEEPAELIQMHLAKAPDVGPLERADVPAVAIDLVMRLLSKEPAQRPADCSQVADQLRGPVRRSSIRPAGVQRAALFRMSDRLFGRDELLENLRTRLSAARDAVSVTFIEGAAGMGKTALLRALDERVVNALSCSVYARFHYAADDIPLSGWASALGGLADELLTRDGVQLERYRHALLESLGEWASLICALVPQWQAILRSAAPKLAENPEASTKRLALAVHRLLGCYAELQGAIVLVLDDLHWADASSLRILELVLTAPEPIELSVVAALRVEEGAHAQIKALRQRLAALDVDVASFELAPLRASEVGALFSDSCGAPIEDLPELSESTLVRTGGCPLFVRELLRSLVERGVLQFDQSATAFSWTRKRLHEHPVADSVSELLAKKIDALPERLQRVLRLSACLGIHFSVADYAASFDTDPISASFALEEIVSAGLMRERAAPSHRYVLAVDAELTSQTESALYEFVHDRVFDAALALSTSDEQCSLHMRAARGLAKHMQAEPHGHELLRIMRHYNAARSLVTDPLERLRCARWSLAVGAEAKLRGAYSQALDELSSGLVFLGCGDEPATAAQQAAWREHFDLTLALHQATAEAAVLNGAWARMESLCAAALIWLETPLQRVPFFEMRISGLKAQGRFADTVAVALQILAELDTRFPRSPTPLHILLGYVLTKQKVRATGLAALETLSPANEPRMLAISRIIHAVYPAAYLGNPNLFPLLVYRHVVDSLKHGNSELSSVTYTGFAAVLCAMGDFNTALELGDVGVRLLKHLNAPHLKARVYAVYYFLLYPWKYALQDSVPNFLEGIKAGLEYGDIEFSCYMMNMHALARFHSGGRLGTLSPELESHRDKTASLGHARSLSMQQLMCQLVADLHAECVPARPLHGEAFNATEMLAQSLDVHDENLAFHTHLAELVLSVVFGDFAQARTAARAARPYYQHAAFGSYISVVFTFYESLAYLGCNPRRGGAAWRRLARNRRQLARWARAAPMNFANKHHLVEAERARVLGRGPEASQHFEAAMSCAEKYGLLHELALAQELAARHNLGLNMTRVAHFYLREAYRNYQSWGAHAKVSQLESMHTDLLDPRSSKPRSERPSASSGFEAALDYRAVLKSSQAISGEIVLPKLLERLLATILAHAGAQRGVLLLEQRGELFVEMECDVDGGMSAPAQAEHLDASQRISRGVVHYAARTERPVVLGDAALEGPFRNDPYVMQHRPRSLLCLPILHQARLVGLVYLENNRLTHVFSAERLEVIELLAGQAAISIANARYHRLQLEAQQAKINPHFLFNALSSIADLTISDGKTAEQAIVDLANLYRYILTSSTTTMVSLQQELQIVRQYLSLEKLRHGAKLEFRVIDDGASGHVMLPGLLIQPLVENAIRHSIAPRVGQGHVSVEARVEGPLCCITIQDDGDGLKHGTAGTGFGLRSVQERLSLVYGNRYTFAISRSPGYRVELEIPVRAHDDNPRGLTV